MLRSVKEIKGYKILAEDEKFGDAKDLLFDDHEWIVRYLVVDTGKWLPGRKVIIPPTELEKPDWVGQALPVKLTRKQIEEGPPLNEDEPVSRQYQKRLQSFFGWSPYWVAGVPESAVIAEMTQAEKEKGEKKGIEPEGDPHLRSCEEIVDYHIKAEDGEIGHVEDFILDDELWQIRYLVVDTRNWLPGKKVLVAISWIKDISWANNQVDVEMTREAVKESPEFDQSAPVNREYEERLYDYYGRPKYWL
ncbi:MAG: PRC-barrel domain containing protein [candidate division Zixibacteria bacterium]|nr:PRC-barrel domain containing protein [candidate division Zixibacteria bacterium]